MFETLKKWLGFTGQKRTDSQETLAVRYRSLADIPIALDLQGKTIVVCRGGSLALRKENELPDRLKPDEVCWIVPGEDVELPLDFQYDNSRIQAEATIRFEADGAFARYAATLAASGEDRITRESLARFVAGQWSELLLVQNIALERLEGAEAASNFRTNLSLLLQESGFRCVALKSISATGMDKKDEPVEELPPEAADELQDAVAAAGSEQGWDRLLDQLDEAGFRPSPADAERLESLGQNYCDKKISAEDTALQIQKMIRRKNLEIGLIAEDVARWNATDAKLRLLDSLDGNPEDFLLQAGDDTPGVSRVPSTWHILRRRKIDDKLRKYLKNSVTRLSARLEAAVQRQQGILNKSKFVRSQATFRRISDKIGMLPSLSTGVQGFRRKRRDYDELIEAVRRSVTAVQLTDGILGKLAGTDYMEPERDLLIADLESTLQTLENEIDERKNVYGI